MEIIAPVSRYHKNNLKLYGFVCLILAVVFAYDGYLSKYEWSGRSKFYKEHVLDNGGQADGTMAFNRGASPILLLAAVGLFVYFLAIKDRKLTADEEGITIDLKTKIPYDRMEAINKTYFESKGYFAVTYKDQSGKEKVIKISNRSYDNLKAVLEHLVAKIS